MSNRVNYDLHYTLVSQNFLDYDGTSYLKVFFENAQQSNSLEQLLIAHLGLSLLNISPTSTKNTRFHLKEAERYAYKIGTSDAKYKLHNYKAIFYQSYSNEFEKAQIHIDSMLYYAKLLDSPNRIDSSLKTQAYSYTLLENYKDAIQILLKAEKLSVSENIYNRKKGLYQYLALNHENLGQNDSALFYYKKMVAYRDSINISTQNTILTLLETSELSQKNLVLDAENMKNRSRFYWAITLLIIALITGGFLVIHYRNKKYLAEKDKELKAIDARNEEKDRQRQRIASALHDNLGGLIVAIQQCFENLKANQNRFLQEEENLMTKARELLDEAYQKIRNMAYLEESASRNSGYWIDVIKDFASIINESDQISIEVQSHGTANIVNTTIENELRQMTTELITNAVKHAKASEISVDITASENALTIIVEDDGIGFDKSKLKNQKGLGLYSIDKKVTNLKGKFSIEPVLGHGTTLIIEIPI
jgi:signal transduction histidine kinase